MRNNSYSYLDYEILGKVREKTTESLGELSGKKILDIGTGDGLFAIELAKRGADVFAIDVVESYLKDAEERAEKENFSGKINFLKKDFYENGFPEGSFDFVVTFIALCDTAKAASLEKFLETAKRLLKSNGVLLLAEEVPEGAESVAEKTGFELNKGLGYMYFSENEIVSGLENAGFGEIKTEKYRTGRSEMDFQGAKEYLDDELGFSKLDGTKLPEKEKLLEEFRERIEKNGLTVDAEITVFRAEKKCI